DLILDAGATNGTGNKLDNLIIGNDSGDVLDGQTGSDTVVGGAGTDLLIGAQGNDILVGGQGSDTFNFQQNGFSGFAPGTIQSLYGDEAWVTGATPHIDPGTVQSAFDTLLLPGSASDYHVTVQFGTDGQWKSTDTRVQIGTVTLNSYDIEEAK